MANFSPIRTIVNAVFLNTNDMNKTPLYLPTADSTDTIRRATNWNIIMHWSGRWCGIFQMMQVARVYIAAYRVKLYKLNNTSINTLPLIWLNTLPLK